MAGGAGEVLVSKKRLDSLVVSTNRIARGNLEKRVIQSKGGDELSKLASSLESLRKGLLKRKKSNLKDISVPANVDEKVGELEKMNKLMIGRELKMIELKKEIEELKQGKNIPQTVVDSRYSDGIKLEESVVESLENEYEKMIQASDLKRDQKELIITKLQVLLSDSKRHEQALRDLS
ncbi:MAG: HAMP domain-containing protein [Candidatus Berkelbacteria bacterium]